jgi:branched-chain amino acid transport system permease protein
MYPPIPWISDSIVVFNVTIKRVTVITPLLVIVLIFGLVWLIHHTKVGIAMRAVAKDFETSQLMGIKIDTVISVVFVIGSFLAAVASALFYTNYPGVFPFSGAMPGMKAFVAAVFGGIGSIPGAVLGGFIIGVCESLIKGLDTILGPAGFGLIQTQWELATFSDAFTFFLLIVILIYKPTGLFGEKATDKV